MGIGTFVVQVQLFRQVDQGGFTDRLTSGMFLYYRDICLLEGGGGGNIGLISSFNLVSFYVTSGQGVSTNDVLTWIRRQFNDQINFMVYLVFFLMYLFFCSVMFLVFGIINCCTMMMINLVICGTNYPHCML